MTMFNISGRLSKIISLRSKKKSESYDTPIRRYRWKPGSLWKKTRLYPTSLQTTVETIGTWPDCSLECSSKVALLISKKRKSYDTWKWKYRRESKKISRSSRKSDLKNFWQPHFKRIWFETFTSNRCRSVRDGRNTLFLAFRMMP